MGQSRTNMSSLSSLVAKFSSKRILVVGDLMLDEFIWGRVSRISPEAPVPVVSVNRESYYPGGAANVARNVRELRSGAVVVGRAGEDAHARQLFGLLEAQGIDTSPALRDAAYPTAVKTRVIARNQQVVRVDRESTEPLSAAQTDQVARLIDGALDRVDAVIVADYGKGLLSQPLADFICGATRGKGKILTVDPHPRTSLIWRGATAIKPNRAEAFLAAGMQAAEPVDPPTRDGPLLEAGKRLLALWETPSLLITLGEQGMLLLSDGREPRHLPAAAKEVFDVSGAGDTAIAVLTLGLAAGAAPEQAAELANHASGIVVGKLGTATVTAAELEAACAGL